jgi:hypothetical protein
MAKSTNAVKYKLVFDILFDSNEELYHDVLTRHLVTELDNCKLSDEYNDNEKCTNFLYRVCQGEVSEYFAPEVIDNIKKETGSIFKALSNDMKSKYNLENYIIFSGYYSGVGRKTEMHIVLSKPIAFILETLYEKKYLL